MNARIAIAFAVAAACLIVHPLLARTRRPGVWARTALAAWALAIAYLALLSRRPSEEALVYLKPMRALRYIVRLKVPLGEWARMLLREGIGAAMAQVRLRWKFFSWDPILNVLVFLPPGTLLPWCFERVRRHLWIAALAGLAASMCIEFTQLAFRLGTFEMDDMICNTLGAALGALIFRAYARRSAQGRRAGRGRPDRP